MRIYRDFPLKDILYYKIGGKAKILLKIENKDDLFQALDFVQKEKPERILPIGLGSNLLVNDKFFDGVVLWFSRYKAAPGRAKSSSIKLVGDDLVEAFVSEDLDDLINFSFDNGLVGLEWAGGLPSTIGGAVRGNVGAFGGEIKDAVKIVEIVKFLEGNDTGHSGDSEQRDAPDGASRSMEDPRISKHSRRFWTSQNDGKSEAYIVKKFNRDQLEFAYRDSIIKQNKNLVIVSATFQLQKGSKEEVEKARQIYFSKIEYRNKNHPMEFPSCGSVFKNIVGKEDVEKAINKWPDIQDLVVNKWYNKVSTGYIINRLGFSGFRIGGAKVSEKHANYIVNFDNASFNDVFSIIQKIKEKFYKAFAFYPELEIEVVE